MAGKKVVEQIFQGFNGTILAYGQTSSGKTFTMMGTNLSNPSAKGIIPRVIDDIFQIITKSPSHIEFKISVSMVEIYMEKIKDLLNVSNDNLQIREDKQKGIYIQDASEIYVASPQEIFSIIQKGNSNRSIGSTNMNEQSSRSHMLFMIEISQTNTLEQSAKKGKLFLVDLAGSEKINKTGATGQILNEGIKINMGLLELGNVINQLCEGKMQYINYRNSKLTRILQESLGGNSKTTLIITLSPSSYNEQETLSTLRFGQRAKLVKNKPKINKEFTVPELLLLVKKNELEKQELTTKVQGLEKFIVSKGFSLIEVYKNIDITEREIIPKDKENVISQSQKLYSLESEIDEDNSRQLKTLGNSEQMSEILDNDLQNLNTLKKKEEELQKEKIKVTIQTEKIKLIRQEFSQLNAKYTNKCQENEKIMEKLIESINRQNVLCRQIQGREQLLQPNKPTNQNLELQTQQQQEKSCLPTLSLEQTQLDLNNSYILNLYTENQKLKLYNKDLIDFIKCLLSMQKQVKQAQHVIDSLLSQKSMQPENLSTKPQEILSNVQNLSTDPKKNLLPQFVNVLQCEKGPEQNLESQTIHPQELPQQQQLQQQRQQLQQQQKEQEQQQQQQEIQISMNKQPTSNSNNFSSDTLTQVHEQITKAKFELMQQFDQSREKLLIRMEQLSGKQIELDNINNNQNYYQLEIELAKQGQAQLIKKYEILKKNFSQLQIEYQYTQYQQFDQQNEITLYENKLKRYNQRIQNLEKELAIQKEQSINYKSKFDSLNNLKNQLQDIKAINLRNQISDNQFLSYFMQKVDSINLNNKEVEDKQSSVEQPANIVKTLKGGLQYTP